MVTSKKGIKTFGIYALLIFFVLFMCYPLIWMLFSSFKTNFEILGSYKLLPEKHSDYIS